MSDVVNSRKPPRQRAVRINAWYRGLAVGVGLTGLASGGVAVFVTHVEAGPVALVAAGVVLFLTGIGGRMPTRLKFGDNEAEWLEEVEAVARLQRTTPEVERLLDDSGATFDSVLEGRSPSPGPALAEAGSKVGAMAADVELLINRSSEIAVPPNALLELARWHLTNHNWSKAAGYLEEFADRGSPDWRTYFSLGVAYANQRGGPTADLRALRGYNEALAFMPTDADPKMRARAFSYRAGVEKRLHRYLEARSDATIALELATEAHERRDALYNLATVAALMNDRDETLRWTSELVQMRGGASLVIGHLGDYFVNFSTDPELRRLLGLGARS